jgi:hypothetical protein
METKGREEELRAEVRTLTASVAQKVEMIETVRIRELSQKISEWEEREREREAVGLLTAENDRKHSVIQSLEAESDRKSAMIKSMEADMNNMTATINRLEADMVEKVKGLMVGLDKAKQDANKALVDFEAELKLLQSEVDALEETTTDMRTKLLFTQAQLSLTTEDVQRCQEREEKLQAELMTAKTEMQLMKDRQKDLEGQLAAASSSCKAMTEALKGEMFAVYEDCMLQLSSSEEVVRRLSEHSQKQVQYFLERKEHGVLASAFECLREHVEEERELMRKAVCTDVDRCLEQTLKELAELSEDLVRNSLAEKANKALESEKTELLVLVSIHLPNEYLNYIAAQLVALQQQMQPELDDKIKKIDFAINTLRQVVFVCVCMCSLQACTHTREFAWHAYCMIMMNLP